MSLGQKNDTNEGIKSNKLSIENIIALIRQMRNDIVKELLQKDNIQSHFIEQFGKSLSPVKREFLIRDLKELLILPVDLVHYSSLINQIKESKINIEDCNKTHFHQELQLIFDKYKY